MALSNDVDKEYLPHFLRCAAVPRSNQTRVSPEISEQFNFVRWAQQKPVHYLWQEEVYSLWKQRKKQAVADIAMVSHLNVSLLQSKG